MKFFQFCKHVTSGLSNMLYFLSQNTFPPSYSSTIHSCLIIALTSFESLTSCPPSWSGDGTKFLVIWGQVLSSGVFFFFNSITVNYLCTYYLPQKCKPPGTLTSCFSTLIFLVSSIVPGTEEALNKHFLNELTE